jgi:nucleotidyltransferase substrate binding protein (TIGR01987 family)
VKSGVLGSKYSSQNTAFQPLHNSKKSLICQCFLHEVSLRQYMLILTPFTKALESLEMVLKEGKTDIVRDSAIQRFEYTYELGFKMLKRYLEMSDATTSSIDEMSFRELMRLGAEKGCLTNPEKWSEYREARNISSHAYDAKKAEEIYAILPAFAKDARALHDILKERAPSV